MSPKGRHVPDVAFLWVREALVAAGHNPVEQLAVDRLGEGILSVPIGPAANVIKAQSVIWQGWFLYCCTQKELCSIEVSSHGRAVAQSHSALHRETGCTKDSRTMPVRG